MRSIMPKRLVPLTEALATVHQHCGMLDEFKHWQQTHLRKPPAPGVLIAGIMGLGCAIGTEKMGRISKAVDASELANAVNWRFSLDNIIAANDKVVAAMERMELPQIYRNSTTSCTRPAMGKNSRSGSLHSTPVTRSSILANCRGSVPTASSTSAGFSGIHW